MKFTKIIMAGLVITSVLLGSNLGTHAEAATPEAGKSIKSKGDVSFKLDDSTTPPVDPTDPDKPVTPDEPGESTSGPLSIDHVSNLHFGEQIISAKSKTYYANLEKVTMDGNKIDVPNYVQITDKRGSNEGWTLTVKQDTQFTTTEDVAAKELKGAVLKLNNTQVQTTTDNKAKKPTPTTEIALEPGGDALPVLVANKDEGMGLWTGSFGDENTAAKSVSLSVPGESAKYETNYSTELTWNLASTPI
ncbi:WxL domain-containing protein [Enterococcus faecalis]|uniref:WxL domain-containing protein n=1 Tax=Enterococcus faecalis TaxID=1351 RepID=A0ABD7IZS3_ENTFL|nr:WxL domain-containing protein [Enterococcus faecalis]EGO2744203.1 WxL domain-containing protein [Enterococcus faecalis]EGO2804328.1 WxL domain-containing protein [Enterococcus faecalis]EGO2812979.1 WxL domain-containing protein [Enterococcus faecalis]EGO2831916.1 WxL domain-containing protein [Enterococcus faecalis]EGO5087798.1 WxL domain-containing protein [Enterococcus faecalis]